MQKPLALLSKPLYFPKMKYLNNNFIENMFKKNYNSPKNITFINYKIINFSKIYMLSMLLYVIMSNISFNLM